MKLFIALILKVEVFSLVSAVGFDFLTDLNAFQGAAKRVVRSTKNPCIQPPITADKNYTVKFPLKDDVAQAKPGEVVPQFTIIVSQCSEGYAIDYHAETLISNELPSVCTGNSWQPPILKCKKVCKNFKYFSNFNMTCYEFFGGPKISCSGLLLERAIAIPRCQQKFHPDKKVNYEYATCQENGNWDKTFFKCIPDCGLVSSSSQNLIAGGYAEKRGGAPWNVAIYSTEYSNDEPQFICGGTLVSADVVVSAAHCFYDEVFHQNQDPRLFHAVVGKATLPFKSPDYPSTKSYKFKSIYFPETTYKGAVTNYASDIVVIELDGKVTFSQDVLPACLYREDKDHFNPGESVMGKLSGFGVTENGTQAFKLMSANLPYISYSECLKKVREDFLGSISIDKFCAGSEKGAGARTGDSGGGLLFTDSATGLYHLRGVVSNKDLSSSSIATFTDITQYITWILRMIEASERNIKTGTGTNTGTGPSPGPGPGPGPGPSTDLTGDAKTQVTNSSGSYSENMVELKIPNPSEVNVIECKKTCNPDGVVSDNSCTPVSAPCSCKVFVAGRDCDSCKDGFWNLQADNTDGCVACGCNSIGSYSSTCDKNTGSCQCKPNVIGRQCDECVDNIRVLGANGCEVGPKWVKYENGDKCSNAVVGGHRQNTNEVLYPARHQYSQHLLPGKLEPSIKKASVAFHNKEHQFSEYEVLCGGFVEWVPATYGKFPKGSVAGGTNFAQAGDETLYVCRAAYGDGSIIPGKLHPSLRLCYITSDGNEYPRHIYEVLVQHNLTACECDPVGSYSSICKEPSKTCKCKPNVAGKNCDRCAKDRYLFGPKGCKEGPKWVRYADGEKCPNAVVGGKTAKNETLYIARHDMRSFSLLTGKLVPSMKYAYVTLDGAEHSFSEYQVLCGGTTKWVAGLARGEFPPEAFAGGHDYFLETMYICRATLDDGSLVPGRLHPSQKICFLPDGGKEIRKEHYEALQVV